MDLQSRVDTLSDQQCTTLYNTQEQPLIDDEREAQFKAVIKQT